MNIRIRSSEIFIHNLHTRIPFRFGITELNSVPHMFLKIDVDIDGIQQTGVAADTLIQKWFTKDPSAKMENEIDDLLTVIQHAADVGVEIGTAGSVFDLWLQLSDHQMYWGETNGFAPLLANFGVTVIERALIDAVCRLRNTSFYDALKTNLLGIDPAAVYPELTDFPITKILPEKPLEKLYIRHTVGLSDPIRTADIFGDQRVEDGLPQSLEENIDAYGLQYFKIKVNGDFDQDYERIRQISTLFEQKHLREFYFTLDGNEQFYSIEQFREYWDHLNEKSDINEFLTHLLYVEQPLSRQSALTQSTGDSLERWKNHPPLIIDESDCCMDSFKTAVSMGYQGTSHKNCKGVIKSILNSALMQKYKLDFPSSTFIMSAEDLVNIGPVALLQDLAVISALGINHAERNGHQYFKGLSMFPDEIQDELLMAHPDLYVPHPVEGFPTLDIQDGAISTRSVNQAPFGYSQYLDPGCCFIPETEWKFESLEIND